MKISSALAPIVFFAVASKSIAAGFKSDAYEVLTQKGIEIVAIDNSDGCWQQADAAKTYLSEVMAELGHRTVAESDFRFAISVTAKRLKPVPQLRLGNQSTSSSSQVTRCFGSVELISYTLQKSQIPGTLTIFSSSETTFTHHDAVDEVVFSFIEANIDFLK